VNKTSNVRQIERPFGEKSRLVERQDSVHITILVTIALVIGVYLIATTILINKDGVLYIEQAQNFSSDPSLGVRGIYPPGYPFLIYIAHRIVTLLSNSVSVETWIYSAQSVSLLCRMLSLIPLYFIGKLLVGSRNSYLALLILIFLPYPAEYGSEIVREWSHLFFLATAFFFLTQASTNGNWQMFAAAGLFAGIGYMIRPECAQIVLYGMLWLLVGLFIPRAGINRLKAVCLTLILIIGFLIPAVPYSIMRGELLPPKLKEVVSSDKNYQIERVEKPVYIASVTPKDILMAFGKLTERIGENLMYFFMLPLIIGLYYHFRRPKELLADGRLFISALIILYIAMMLLLHINFGYMSRRHFMPMIVFTAFYIPTGLLIIADWISGINITGNENKQKNTQKWFFILLTAGMLICFVKLSGLIGVERKGYREAAKWLKENTAPADIIVVPDARIAFYAERKGLEYLEYNEKISEQAGYIVRIVKSENEKLGIGKDIKEEYSTWVDKKKNKKIIVIRRPTK
jgi:4-amino-4-deoxy-L-arabinose transferase-like glycosyltransferase